MVICLPGGAVIGWCVAHSLYASSALAILHKQLSLVESKYKPGCALCN